MEGMSNSLNIILLYFNYKSGEEMAPMHRPENKHYE